MEKLSVQATVKTHTLTVVETTMVQANFKPGHKRSGSDVTDRHGKETVIVKGRIRTYSENLQVQDKFNSTRRKSSDVVDSIGDKHAHDMETKETEVDGDVGVSERPTTLDMKSTGVKWTQKQEAWRRTDRSSKEETDATPCTPPETSYNYNSDSSCVEMEVHIPVDWDASEYNMQHKRRGRAVIFNNDIFETEHYAPREGSKIDVKTLCETFSSLLFDVTVHDNLEYSEVKHIVSELAAEDHSDADCIAVIVLTHGENGMLAPRDSQVLYNVDMLWKPFTADKCPTLAGKPKLFFIQACRGKNLDAGIKVKMQGSEFDSSPSSHKIPTQADFLIAYSTAKGFYSFRNKDTGSWFIQSLCKELNSSDNLLQILTRATRRVTQLESDSNVIEFHEQKQVPSITTMLTRDLYFHPKS